MADDVGNKDATGTGDDGHGELPQRRSIRLRGYDYASAGAYFVTLFCHSGQAFFGDIADGAMRLNGAGLVAEEEWRRSATIRQEMLLDQFVIMPNHLHGIVFFGEHAAARLPVPGEAVQSRRPCVRQGGTLGSFVAGYKAAVTRRVNQLREKPVTLWQRNYYERIIRNDQELTAIREYIVNNPLKWEIDKHI